ncbi:MAG: hypothetical protein IKC71_00060 [Clostridia bacterium]|nr:hypothetical protein [Clostridia bacterium]
MDKERKLLRWVRLDNAAKIYPAARRKNWSNIYRQSATLRDEVDVLILKSALDLTVKRFPSIASRLRRGLFWFYLLQLESAPDIREEYSYPLTYMSNKEMKACAFRVIAYKNRIAVEFFHSLTDGHGALIFLKNLVAEYLEQKYGISIPFEHGIIDRKEEPRQEEIEDCFPKYAGPITISRKDTNAWHMYGETQKNGFLNLTCFKLPVKECLDLAHKYNATLTMFMSACMMMALVNLQKEKEPNILKQKRIKLLIPINLRNLFPSNTLRNFSMYTIPEIDPRLGEYTLQEICDVIKHKMGLEFTAKHMSRVIATNVSDEKNPLVRLIPLPIKNLVMKAIFNNVGEKKSCMDFSNIGKITLPEIMNDYVDRFDFILGVHATSPYNASMLSFKDTVYINFIRDIVDPELEKHFYKVLKELNLPVTVESNKNER